MNLYIFENAKSSETHTCHPYGSVVVVAKTLPEAREFAAERGWEADEDVKIYYLVDNLYKQRVYEFSDFGCC